MELESATRLGKDIKKAAATLSVDEARYLVDAYYQMQGDRIRSDNQVRALTASEEPHATIAWLAANSSLLERNIKLALDAYGNAHAAGRWSKSIVGIGPVISAGLLAHIDLEPWRCVVVRPAEVGWYNPKADACHEEEPHGPQCHKVRSETVGHLWRFAGLDPTVSWEKKEKRPWNATLKTLCYKIGESFVKVSGHEDDIYGKVYLARKAQEVARNEAGFLAAQATEKLEKFKIGKDTDAFAWYGGALTAAHARQIAEAPTEKRLGLVKKLAGAPGSGQPMLPPAHIHARARRYTVKLFLSHYHATAYFAAFGVLAPKPYVIEHLGHANMIAPPNMEYIDGMEAAWRKAGLAVND